MFQKYLDNIKPFDPKDAKSGFCFLNEKFRETILEDVYKYEFYRLYPSLLVNFYKLGYLSDLNIDVSIIERVDKYLKGPTPSDPIERVWVNSLYISELKKEALHLFDLYYQYMYQFYKDIIINDNIIYIDTDYFISKNEIDISEIGLKYEKINIPYFWAEARKRIVIHENGVTKIKRFPYKNFIRQSTDKIVSEIKKRIRNKRLDLILS